MGRSSDESGGLGLGAQDQSTKKKGKDRKLHYILFRASEKNRFEEYWREYRQGSGELKGSSSSEDTPKLVLERESPEEEAKRLRKEVFGPFTVPEHRINTLPLFRGRGYEEGEESSSDYEIEVEPSESYRNQEVPETVWTLDWDAAGSPKWVRRPRKSEVN